MPMYTRTNAIPNAAAVNCTSSSSINACLEAAKKYNSPVMIQVSNGGGAFMVGKAIKEANAAVAGSVALAMHVRSVAKYYGVPVVLHSDHCAKKLLPWFDGMLKADEEFYAKYKGTLSPQGVLQHINVGNAFREKYVTGSHLFDGIRLMDVGKYVLACVCVQATVG